MPAGRKLQQRDDNSGVIVADTDQTASNSAVNSTNVNQANANQNAQAAGNGASASNGLAVDQRNGKSSTIGFHHMLGSSVQHACSQGSWLALPMLDACWSLPMLSPSLSGNVLANLIWEVLDKVSEKA